ncbi:hypothetical protein Sjap_005289 [Stephania japonica]|uniref:Major facilitator superfamily (MFS) profile domain-containing protein n=1 Tax=Stephania japonica TaxID=461633 RepID=A0AAP0K3Z5_9MAGN
MSCVRVIADFYTLRKEVEVVTQRVEEIRASAGVQQLEEELSVLEKNASDRTVVVVIVLALKFGHGVVLEKGYVVTHVIAICTFVAAYGWSWGPLGWLVPSELFPLEMRSAGQSVVVCVNLFFTVAVAQFFLISLCHLKYGIFILFGGLILIMATFIFFLLPETNQVPIEEVYLLFQKHPIWGKVVGTTDEIPYAN